MQSTTCDYTTYKSMKGTPINRVRKTKRVRYGVALFRVVYMWCGVLMEWQARDEYVSGMLLVIIIVMMERIIIL
jgi:hypothetical protein